ncbi:hypothetical protein [Microbacterium sp. 13-71-7]|uniref:hypothetical protein n=1 Tax=Microbacterium sp. 13-71-7 TaxID=1970399 RepID=UPI0025F238A0|nr:hypothetical protein [Microbacterium sp. 13-71-7]
MKKTRSFRRLRGIVAVAVAIALSAASSSSAFAAETTPPPQDESATSNSVAAKWVAIGADGSRFTPSGPLVAAPSQAAPNEASPYLLDPPTWYFCYVLNNETYPISEYFAAYFSGFQGTINLTCGNTAFGYKHIEAGHANDWGHYGSIVGGTWDDFMGWAVGSTLGAPSSIGSQAGQKLCYTAPIWITNGVEDVVVWSKVIISENNRWVITAYPSSSPLTC